jgi:hypothetical protein
MLVTGKTLCKVANAKMLLISCHKDINNNNAKMQSDGQQAADHR